MWSYDITLREKSFWSVKSQEKGGKFYLPELMVALSQNLCVSLVILFPRVCFTEEFQMSLFLLFFICFFSTFQKESLSLPSEMYTR